MAESILFMPREEEAGSHRGKIGTKFLGLPPGGSPGGSPGGGRGVAGPLGPRSAGTLAQVWIDRSVQHSIKDLHKWERHEG